jgi:hypothetical protein
MSLESHQDSAAAPLSPSSLKGASAAATPTPATATGEQSDWVDVIRQHVASLRFGVIQVVIHEGRVVQIERTEKYRLNSRSSQP